MRILALSIALIAAQGVRCAPGPDEFRARRHELAGQLHDGVLVLAGGTDRGEENIRTGFFQEPNFYYLTGWREPGALLLIAPAAEGQAAYAALFLPQRQPESEKWTGRKLGPDDPEVARISGFETVLPRERFESELRQQLDRCARVYTLLNPANSQFKELAPLREVTDAGPLIARLRMRKSPAELALIQKAIDATLDAHRAAWKRAAPGLYEYQVAATMTSVYFDEGCARSAYAPIVGAGPDSTILHYMRNSRRMDRGELLLMDVGAECGGYAADITRTIPVGARFSPRQREIYEIVLGAQNAVIAAIKPGVPLRDLTKVAREYINTHGKDLHGEPLGKYFTHGVSHHVGLDVHDATDFTQPLAENNVITVEPGIYIPDENIGVRIEDMVLVTGDGARLLSGALPRDPDEIEKAIGR
ncbi:MAG TPA: Xaa-Pro peptidase family protein [Bryobacteraceae bacterium]|nr:Xaa-Pro peptidase family protein [Bryobacteraceae bacterium]